MTRPHAPLALLLATLALACATTADTITVCLEGCDHVSINAAIDAANDGDVIQLAAEIYIEEGPIDTDGKAVTIRGVVAEDESRTPLSILDGNGTHRVLVCRSGEDARTVFENLVITNGHDRAGGNGMANLDASNPTLRNCTFTLNGGSAASALLDGGSMASFTRSGGGMINEAGSSPRLIGCRFIGNNAWTGGGMCNEDAHPSLIDCIFIENAADGPGGGMYNLGDSRPTLLRCRFERNVAANGAGMNNCGGNTPRLEACVFVGNVSEFDGGGLNNCTGSAPILRNCTFRANEAGRRGGGIHNDSGGPTVLRCTFESNVPDSITYATEDARPRVMTIDPNVTGDLDGDGDYDATDVRLAMIEFGIVEAMPGSPEDVKGKSAP